MSTKSAPGGSYFLFTSMTIAFLAPIISYMILKQGLSLWILVGLIASIAIQCVILFLWIDYNNKHNATIGDVIVEIAEMVSGMLIVGSIALIISWGVLWKMKVVRDDSGNLTGYGFGISFLIACIMVVVGYLTWVVSLELSNMSQNIISTDKSVTHV